MDINALWQQYGAAHPVLSHLLTAIVAPYLWAKAQDAIPALTDWADARQDALLKKAGLTQEQIWAAKAVEIRDMRAAADELEARLRAQRAAAASAGPATPATNTLAAPPPAAPAP